MGKFYTIRYSFIFVLIGFLLGSCVEKDSDKDGLTDEKDKCPLVMAKTKDGCPVPRAIEKIHFYLDNSASMGGYFKGSTDYKTIVSDLAVKIDKEIKPLDMSFIADKTIRYLKDMGHFPTDIATTNIADQNSSQLHLMIDQITAHTGGNDVSLLVSDCILSFPDSAIQANQEINKTDAIVLRSNVYRTFVDLKKKGLGASLYAFQSRFNGIYYDYQNRHIKLKDIYRPFYVFVIAQKDILAIFDAKMIDISSFQPQQALHFGMIGSAVTRYHILPQLGRIGHWKKIPSSLASGDKGLEDIEINKAEPVMFNLALDLAGLPAYARDLSYLKKNLQFSTPGCKATFTIKQKSDVNADKVKSKDQLISLEGATHVVEVCITEMRLPNARLQLTLPLKYDTWYSDWSCPDDKQIASQGHQTFAFNYLVDGLIQAYETKNKNYISLTLNLNQ